VISSGELVHVVSSMLRVLEREEITEGLVPFSAEESPTGWIAAVMGTHRGSSVALQETTVTTYP